MTNFLAKRPPLQKRGITWKQLDWPVIIVIGLTHVGAFLLAPFYFSWSGLGIALLFMWLSAGVGITLCYHRLLTHRSFKTPKWFEYVLTICGCLAWQGGPIQWVGTHRIHHKHSDEDADPHTPRHGFSWAHSLWCLHRHANGSANAIEAAKDLHRDPFMRFMNTYFILPQLVLAAVLFTLGHYLFNQGMSWVVWGVMVRTVVVYHGTWFVNSAAHTWGYRNFKTKDNSTNLWWVALLSFGEGWHNNHHAQQRSAAHGMRWFEIDMTYWLIRTLGLVGLARDVVMPKKTFLNKDATAEPDAPAPAPGTPGTPELAATSKQA